MNAPTYDVKTITEASGLLQYLLSSKFISSFTIAEHMLGYTKNLSKQLQGSSKSIAAAYDNIDDVISTLKAARSSDLFDTLWEEMTSLNNGEEIAQPRTVGRQTTRSNPEVDSPKSYFRCVFFYPYLDHLIEELERRFENKATITNGFLLIPSLLRAYDFKDFKERVQIFASKHMADLHNHSAIEQELNTWFQKWKLNPGSAACNSLEKAYKATLQSGMYPSVSYLLKLLLTIPVTSATVERANSTLKFIKNDLRSGLSQPSLNALVLGYKHKDILRSIKTDHLVSNFALSKKRRLQLINPLSE